KQKNNKYLLFSKLSIRNTIFLLILQIILVI
ncbi:unnamed protein product, partial [marine sediment metagenome]